MLLYWSSILLVFQVFFLSNTPPRDHGGVKTTNLSLVRSSWNAKVSKGLVRVLKTCNKLGTCWIFKHLDITCSRTKWMSSSICLVCAWRIRLCDRRIILRLSHNSVWGMKGTPSSVRSNYNHNKSDVVCGKAQYSASVPDLETRGCFLELHETRLEPKKMYDLDVEWRSSRLYSPNHNHYRHVGRILKKMELETNKKPWLMVPLKYLKIHLTIYQWNSIGEAMSWPTLLTLKVMFDLVRVTYWSAHTMERYKWGS